MSWQALIETLETRGVLGQAAVLETTEGWEGH